MYLLVMFHIVTIVLAATITFLIKMVTTTTDPLSHKKHISQHFIKLNILIVSWVLLQMKTIDIFIVWNLFKHSVMSKRCQVLIVKVIIMVIVIFVNATLIYIHTFNFYMVCVENFEVHIYIYILIKQFTSPTCWISCEVDALGLVF